MIIAGLAATAAETGNTIELRWAAPGPAAVRVVRRLGGYPQRPEPDPAGAEVLVADSNPDAPSVQRPQAGPDGTVRVIDTGLAAETVHYYRLYPYAGTPRVYDDEPDNRVSAMATGPYGFADLLHQLLPAIYHRYDTVLPAAVATPAEVAALAEADRQRGQLRRFLELPGGQLDQLYSAVRSLLGLRDIERVDGRLLPLLAHWIGWRTDFGIDLFQQRAEIRGAPALYRTIGTIPALDATARRVTGRGARSKEYVDNVLLSNQPQRLLLWSARPASAGAWEVAENPLSVDAASDGRAAAVRDGTGLLLVSATRTGGRSELRAKAWLRRKPAGEPTEEPLEEPLEEPHGWQPSEPVVTGRGPVRQPALAAQNGVLWLFWSAYDAATATWRIEFRTRTDRTWSPVSIFGGPADPTPRRAPAALVDDAGALWLFWLEGPAAGAQLRYSRFATDPWAPTPAGATAFPADDGAVPRVDADLAVLFRPPRPADPNPNFRRIWVLWAVTEPVAGTPDRTRWRVAARAKDGTDPATTSDWSRVIRLPADTGLTDRHDREPAGLVTDTGLTVFLSSTRDGSWAVWAADVDVSARTFGAPRIVTGSPFDDRAPLPVELDGGPALTFRSDRSVRHRSEIYGATETVDARYSGSTTPRAGNKALVALRGRFDDPAGYLHDTGRTDADRYTADTVGIFLEPGGGTEAEQDVRDRLRRVLPEFLPATERAILLTDEGANHG